jgi:large subunit GTPase 1
MIALEKGIDISEVRGGVGKKHFKGGKRREKQRSKVEAAKNKDIDDF